MNNGVRETGFDGACAVLGLDVVAFSVMPEREQIDAVQNVYRWVSESLANHSLDEDVYCWSPAGDGGYLTFRTSNACRKAIDVAFTLAEKIAHPDWVPPNGNRVDLRMGLHAGTVSDGEDLGRGRNVWGVGINTASRILAVSGKSHRRGLRGVSSAPLPREWRHG